MATICGWGRYPCADSEIVPVLSGTDCKNAVRDATESASIIARGLGRSYGDSALGPRVLAMRYLDHLIRFDENTGLLACAAGVSLVEILRLLVPRGWFLPVTPGTRFVTVGGAIASDVHGKNHHVDGAFSRHVRGFSLLLGNGETVRATPEMHPELFRATCGGMGLTGVILSAEIQLKKIASSEIVEKTVKTADLESTVAAFEAHRNATYSVAWIDCLATGKHLGRSLLMLGEHAPSGPLRVPAQKALPVPVDMPPGLLNPWTIRAFNALYYGRVRGQSQSRRISYEPYFYPLDKLANWNRLYGKPGFLQYQFVLPLSAGLEGLRDVLGRIAKSGRGSFLAVLKQFGPGNENYLSFPLEGYTLALDFKVDPMVFALLDELDRVVLDYGGRIYLTKDARMSEHTFKAGYPLWEKFEQVRETYFATGKFASGQSRRLGLQ